MEKEKLAFEQKDRGFKIRAWYLKDGGDALFSFSMGEKRLGKCSIRPIRFGTYRRTFQK